MSVPDKKLLWWRAANRPNGVRCDRNGCAKPATSVIQWRHFGPKWLYHVCATHRDWWASATIDCVSTSYTPTAVKLRAANRVQAAIGG